MKWIPRPSLSVWNYSEKYETLTVVSLLFRQALLSPFALPILMVVGASSFLLFKSFSISLPPFYDLPFAPLSPSYFRLLSFFLCVCVFFSLFLFPASTSTFIYFFLWCFFHICSFYCLFFFVLFISNKPFFTDSFL